jgi:hypothetical protein
MLPGNRSVCDAERAHMDELCRKWAGDAFSLRSGAAPARPTEVEAATRTVGIRQ